MAELKTAVEAAMARSEKSHLIPPMTHPLSQYWEQPNRFDIEVDETHALMGQTTFNLLHDYSNSQPTGAYEGKMWRAFYRLDGWCLLWFGPSDKPDMVSVNARKILIA